MTLLVGTLLSAYAETHVFSTSVLFLGAGFLCGHGGLDFMNLAPQSDIVNRFTEIALFAVLFTEGMQVEVKSLLDGWRLPTRALLVGLPLTMVLIALAAHILTRMGWLESLLLGAALSPTDPVFAANLIGREEVPLRLRRLLNLESGLNDGLALPFVVLFLSLLRPGAPPTFKILAELGGGVLLGFLVPWSVNKLRNRMPRFGPSSHYEPMLGLAIALLLLGLSSRFGMNEFLAAFSGGAAFANLDPKGKQSFEGFGALLAELLKLAVLLVFGSLLSFSSFRAIPGEGYLVAAVTLFLVRPIALGIALFPNPLKGSERFAAAWFGPKGFASVFYGLLILRSGFSRNDLIVELIALVTTASIILHSSTDVVVARWFEKKA